jgi:hypothetical protein
MAKKSKPVSLPILIIIYLLSISALVFGVIECAKFATKLNEDVSANKAKYDLLKSLEEDSDSLNNMLQISNYQAGELENALPSNLLEERIMLDIYRAKYAVGLDKTTLAVGFSGNPVASSVQTALNETTINEDIAKAEAIYNSQRAEKSVSNDTLMKQALSINFTGNLSTAKSFILELERTPRTFIIEDVAITSSSENLDEITCNITLSAYGFKSELDQDSVISEYKFNWYSPTNKGKNNVFLLGAQGSDSELNIKFFNSATPTSYYKDFLMTINAKNGNIPAVTFEEYQNYKSIIGGDYTTAYLKLTQDGDKYFYSYQLGEEQYPPSAKAELTTYRGRDILLGVSDDSALDEVISLGEITLTIENNTDKNLRIIGQTGKRLRIVGDTTNVIY